jgi:GH15 family glucan-1,4-alpha-glucosidase
VRRRYRDDTLVLETEVTTDEGTVRIIDFMPIRGRAPDIVRIVEGVRGHVPVDVELVIRFDYGSTTPWVRRIDGRLLAIAGPDALVLATPVKLKGEHMTTQGSFVVGPGDRVPFVLTWYPSYEEPTESPDPFESLDDTEAWWREWSAKCCVEGRHRDMVMRSLITLMALTYAAASSRRGRRRCRKTSAAFATGTIGSAGSATRRSRCRRCSMPAIAKKRCSGETGCSARSPATRASCRSCTA